MTNVTITLNSRPAVIKEGGIVDDDGCEISWREFLEGEVDCLPEEEPVPLVVVCTENGYGSREVSSYLVGEDIVVHYYQEDGIEDASIDAGVVDSVANALDAAANDIRAVAVSVLGPLLDDNPQMVAPSFQHTPWTFEMGGSAAEDPMLYWTRDIFVDSRVKDLFRERLAAGAYPDLAEMSRVGSKLWRQWVGSLLTATPSEDRVAKDGFPLYTEKAVRSMTDDDLLDVARKAFRRP